MIDVERIKSIDNIFLLLTKAGEYFTFVTFFFIFLILKQYYKPLAILILGAITPLTSHILKTLLHFPRPLTYFNEMEKGLKLVASDNFHVVRGMNSFPSGHTLAAFAIFTLVVLMSKNRYLHILFFLLAACVGISRIYLAEHFIKDVAFGCIVGVLLGIGVFLIMHKKLVKYDDIL